jgi:hypothetical protein
MGRTLRRDGHHMRGVDNGANQPTRQAGQRRCTPTALAAGAVSENYADRPLSKRQRPTMPSGTTGCLRQSARVDDMRHSAAKGVEGAVCVCPLYAAFRAVVPLGLRRTGRCRGCPTPAPQGRGGWFAVATHVLGHPGGGHASALAVRPDRLGHAAVLPGRPEDPAESFMAEGPLSERQFPTVWCWCSGRCEIGLICFRSLR